MADSVTRWLDSSALSIGVQLKQHDLRQATAVTKPSEVIDSRQVDTTYFDCDAGGATLRGAMLRCSSQSRLNAHCSVNSLSQCHSTAVKLQQL